MFADRAVGAVIRPLGFKGTRGTWLRQTADGIAMIGTGRRTLPGSVLVHVGLAVVPVEWWEYVTWRDNLGPQPLSKSTLRYGMRFVESRRQPERGFVHMPPDPQTGDLESAQTALCTAAAELAGIADDLLRPGRYLDGLLAIEDIGYGMWEPVVVLLAERGRSRQLEDAIVAMYHAYAQHGGHPPDRVADYARARAAIRGPRA
ncbi:hypothetical protein [Dactylosporangium sp. CS-033363]|uniref:hypothetical protein n=1 Tax=Dactylosporangium sp. CS-033363 TaxID=3239935 RepID=UPI003D8B694B